MVSGGRRTAATAGSRQRPGWAVAGRAHGVGGHAHGRWGAGGGQRWVVTNGGGRRRQAVTVASAGGGGGLGRAHVQGLGFPAVFGNSRSDRGHPTGPTETPRITLKLVAEAPFAGVLRAGARVRRSLLHRSNWEYFASQTTGAYLAATSGTRSRGPYAPPVRPDLRLKVP
ncbi:hypothetical protein GUJ93_ZPchr0009g1375 [Zizania palustris]|uniref:Uncharacterized protein n=1 Tax=Zizania palustris TaxID=103762 RepID=A0A8J5R1A0_ZIZPA|nr:hypothetical protein GUJ93_ZPchr0009g1375 [Zizania palustris]